MWSELHEAYDCTNFRVKGFEIMAKLDIIIPCYKATKTLERTLASIYMQTIKDEINVYISNDADGLDYSDIIKKFDLNIIYKVCPENCGAGMARQFAMDYSQNEKDKSDYIMFIDADDCLASAFACELLLCEAKKRDADLVVGAFDNDMRNGKQVAIGETVDSTTWLHGKLFKRSYLAEHDICFKEGMRTNEDVYFNQLVLAYEPVAMSVKKICYSWIFNQGSLTRTGEVDNRYNILYDYIGVSEEFALEALRRGLLKNEQVIRLVTDNLMVVYRYYNEILDTHDEEHGERFLKRCKEYYHNALELIPEALDDELLAFSNMKLLGSPEFASRIPTVSIPEFAKSIMG